MSNETTREKCRNPKCLNGYVGSPLHSEFDNCPTCLGTGFMPQAQTLEAQPEERLYRGKTLEQLRKIYSAATAMSYADSNGLKAVAEFLTR